MRSVRGAFGTALMVVALAGITATPALAAGTSRSTRATAPACTDSWTNASGGLWDTASNWSNGVPGSSDTVCITKAGTYTVVIGNETFTVANLTVGGSGSTPTLAIGNGGSGEPAITVSSSVTVASTLSDGWGGNFTAGSVSVLSGGTLLIPATGYTSYFQATTLDVAGSFTVNASLSLTLPTSASTFTNESTGSIAVASGKALPISSPSGQTAAFTQKGLITNNGSLTIAEATTVAGGTICGTTPFIGAGDGGTGGTLTFAATIPAGPSCGSSVPTDQIFVPNVTATISGTIPAAYTVSIGDGGSSFPTVTLVGVTNAGTLSFGWGGTLTGPLTNKGTFVVPATGYTSTFTTTGLDNVGIMDVNASLTIALSASSSTITNEATGSITVTTGKSLAVNGAIGTLVQKGLLSNNGSISVAATLDVDGGSICGNALYASAGDGQVGQTLAFPAKLTAGPTCGSLASGKIFVPNSQSGAPGTITGDIPKGYTVTVGDGGSNYAYETWTGSTVNGTLAPGFGATLTDTNAVTVKGALTVPASGYTTTLNLGGLTNTKKLTINGTGPTNLDLTGGSFTNVKGATLLVGTSTPFTTTSALTSAGAITLDPAAKLSVGGLTQASTSSLTAEINGNGGGTVTVSGTAAVAGKMVTKAVKFKPAHGSSFTPVTASTSLSGTFTKVSGPYTITYTATSVVATFS